MSESYTHSFIGDHPDDLYNVYKVIMGPRNAFRDHRGSGNRPPTASDVPPRGTSAPTPRGGGHYSGPRTVRPTHHDTAIANPQAGASRPDSQVIAIKKTALLELIPIGGVVWASLLNRPDMPKAVGNDIIDLDNASMHRDALSAHQQNQNRIMGLSQLAARAIMVLVD